MSSDQVVDQPKLTIEQEEELKLRSRYPNPPKVGGSAFIQKMLNKGSKKYFDSGDYNMAKSRKQNGASNKPSVASETQPQTAVESATTNTTTTTTATTTNCVSTPIAQTRSYLISQNLHKTNEQMMQQLNDNSPIINVSSHESNVSETAVDETTTTTTNVSVSSTTIPTSTTSSTSPVASSSSTANLSGGNHYLNASQSNQSITMISASLSTDKLSQIHLNQQIIESEEIGHGIPTPECLPSRKHSIVQSKLATPRLSSS